MKTIEGNADQEITATQMDEIDYNELLEPVGYDFGLNRRSFVQLLAAGLLLVVSAPALAQERRRGGGLGGRGARNLAARLHIGTDGTITVMTGKVEGGQGARAELTQAAAEELHLPASQIQLVMSDTGLVPDDGITAGSGSTPRTVPAIRQGAAAARELFLDFAAKQWNVGRDTIQIQDGKATDSSGKHTLTYADLAKSDDAAKEFEQPISTDVTLTSVKEWKVLGTTVSRPNAREIVTGTHQYPSDISRPGMQYGKVLRPPSFGAKLTSIDVGPAKAMKDVTVVQDDSFVGVVAPTSYRAQEALDALAKTAKWQTV